jgi:hypothetical protein
MNGKIAPLERLIYSLCRQRTAFQREVNSFAGNRLVDPRGIAYE